MQKYAIYKILRINANPVWDYGISPNVTENTSEDIIKKEITTYIILERFDTFAVCASTYHAGQRVLKKIDKTVEKYLRQHAFLLDGNELETLTGLQTGRDWPDIPYLENLLLREKTLQYLIVDWEQNKMRRAINEIHARVNATDHGMETESVEELREKAARLGFVWKG